MSILFKNIAKKANDLLSNRKKYTTGGAKKFSIKTKAANGTTYTAEANINGGSASGKISANYSHDNGFKIDKLELDNNGTLTTEITLDKAVDNVQFSVKSKIQPLTVANPKEETTIGATYTNDDFKADICVSPLDPAAADASICFSRDGFNFGASAGLKYDDSGSVDLTGYDFGVAYSKDSSNAAFVVKKKLQKYQFSFFHRHSSDISFAATLDGNCCPKKSGAALEFGGSYNVNSDTTAHAKLSLPNGNTASSSFSFNVDQQLNANTKLGLTSVLPVDFNGAPQFGLNLSFGI